MAEAQAESSSNREPRRAGTNAIHLLRDRAPEKVLRGASREATLPLHLSLSVSSLARRHRKHRGFVQLGQWRREIHASAPGIRWRFGHTVPARCLTPHPLCTLGAVLPNPSFEARPNGRPPGPVWRYAYIFASPGLASRRRSHLSSNVRPQEPARPCVLSKSGLVAPLSRTPKSLPHLRVPR